MPIQPFYPPLLRSIFSLTSQLLSPLPSLLRPLPSPSSSLSVPSLSLSPSLPLPSLNSVRGSGERCELSEQGLGRAPAEIEFGAFCHKIWHQVTTILILIFNYLVLLSWHITAQKFVLSSHATRPSLFTTRPEGQKGVLGPGVPEI